MTKFDFAFTRLSASILSLFLIPWGGIARAQNWQPESFDYEYNAGPAAAGDRSTEILNLYAAQPENKYISDELSPKQKFRFTFGAMMLRTNFAPDSVKIFAIGQDAVDDAELVKLPGTGTGYSTRVQNIANHHGVDQSLATSNASFQTIKGQYGTFGHPFVEKAADGTLKVQQGKFVDNYLWSMFNGASSPIVIHRERAWEWEIENNLKSLRLVILFGAASQDAFAEFLNKRGFHVPARMTDARLARIQVPQSRVVPAGRNNEFPVLLTRDGQDLYTELVGRKLNYTAMDDQKAAIKALTKADPNVVRGKMSFLEGGGLNGSGVIAAAQLGGYDLNETERADGRPAGNSLKGLKLSDGTVIDKDIAFVASPHPTALSADVEQASRTVTEIFSRVQHLISGARAIEPDLMKDGTRRVNKYARGGAFKYLRAFLPRRVVPFGAPDNILRPQSSADRLGAQVLVSEPPSKQQLIDAGFSELKEIFDAAELEAAKNARPIEALNPSDIWSQHSRQEDTRGLSDPGPGEEMARIMVRSLDRSVLDRVKAPGLGFFAHYRGTFDKPRAVVLHDPIDLEDRNTFRAATGRRGQMLNGLMRDLGVEMSQLVLATAPVDLTDAGAGEIEAVRAGTEAYREAVMGAVLARGGVEVIFTDGPMAKTEAARLLAKLKRSDINIIPIERGDGKADAGIAEAGEEAKRTLPQFRSARISGKPAAIPMAHLPWNSRDWERVTSGTVIEAKGVFRGKSYAVVTPNFVAEQELKPLPSTVQGVEALKQGLQILHVPLMTTHER